MAMMWDKDAGAEMVAQVTAAEVEHALDQLRERRLPDGALNTWSSRAALVSTIGMLRQRYEKARCDSDGVASCVRCNVMFLARAMSRLLASADTLPKGQDAQQGLAGTESGAVGSEASETPAPNQGSEDER